MSHMQRRVILATFPILVGLGLGCATLTTLGRIVQPPHVFGASEYRRPGGGGVAPDAFENAAAVVQNVRHDVNRGIGPRNQLAIVPDLLGGLDHV